MSVAIKMENYKEVISTFQAFGQAHIFENIDSLSVEEREKLFHEAKRVDLEAIDRCWKSTKDTLHSVAEVKSDNLKPFDKIADATCAGKNTRDGWWNAGLELVSKSKAGCILMAGGAGTRLGFPHPKGMYDVGLPSHKSLFQIQAERLLKVRSLAAKFAGIEEDLIHIPYYIMTSDGTHHETVEFWASNNYFSLPKDDVFFFQQGMLPALDFDGKIVMETKTTISWAANGNGGIYEALYTSKAIDDMRLRGLEYLHVFCVDNILVRVADPWMFGFCKIENVDCCNKTVEKTLPKEGVGVMCYRPSDNNSNWCTSVVEYSELPTELAEAKDGSKLQYRAGNIAIHCFSLDFLEKCILSRNTLPFHVAKKKIPSVRDPNPTKENGMKMEMFVFDVFGFGVNVHAFQVDRAEEFSPVKNAVKPGVLCTAETACNDLANFNRKLLLLHNIVGPENGELEIDASVTYAGEGLEALAGQKVGNRLAKL